MGRSDDVISLTREIVSSYETRLKDIGQLVTDTNTLLGDFRKEDVERKKNTSKLLGDFRADHEEMNTRLKADLAKVEPELTQAEAERVKQAQADIKERMEQVAKLLGDFRANHEEMSTRLKADLAKVEPELAQAEAERVKQAQIEINERVTSVRELLDEFKTERDRTATAWQALVNVMQAKRGMAAPAVEATPKAPPVAEPAKEEAMAKAEPAEIAKAETETSEASDKEEAVAEESVERTPETTALSGQVFAYLADHPDGTRMTELEEEFGIARIQMARLLKELMEENKAEKRDMLYFAI